MPQIDPKFTFWFGVWTNVLILVAGYGVEHAPAFIATYAPTVQWFCALLAQLNSVVLTAFAGASSNKPGPLTGAPAITPTVIKILIAAVALSFLLAGSGSAQAQQVRAPRLTGDVAKDFNLKPPAPAGTTEGATATDDALSSFGQQVRKITKELVDKAIVDVQAASDDAAKHNDVIAKPCWDANLALLKGLPSQWETPPADIGLALGIQIQRDLLNSITGNDAGSLKVACAALWGDQLKIVANVGALLGVKIATGGLFP